MNRTRWLVSIVCLTAIPALSPAAFAASLVVNLGETVVVEAGATYDDAVVRNGGILILEGGEIGIDATPSVLVEPGGRFVVHSGAINYFENRGVTELYGGTQSEISSENHGHLRIAGGDPGTQIVHLDGTVDVFSSGTNRATWEIDSFTTETLPVIRFYSVTSSLPAGSYTYDTLNPAKHHPYGKSYDVFARFWPDTTMVVQVEVNMPSNWLGTVWSHGYVAPPPPAIGTQAALEIFWTSQPNRMYQAQYTTDLLAGEWRNLGLPVLAKGTRTFVLDATPEPGKTYRVLVLH